MSRTPRARAWRWRIARRRLLSAATITFVLRAAVAQSPMLLQGSAPGQASAAAGEAALARRDADAAVQRFEEAVRANDQSAAFHFALGTAWSMKARSGNLFVKARAASRMRAEWERALELDPAYYDAHESLYQFYRQAPAIAGGSPEQAAAHRDALLRIAPYRAALYFAREAQRAQRFADAVALLRPLVRDYADSLSPAVELVAAQADARRTDDAWATLDAARARFGPRPQLDFQLGRLAAISGSRLDAGARALERLLPLPDDSIRHVNVAPSGVHYRYGMILERRGDVAAARREYETAVRLAPDNPQIRAALDHIENVTGR